MNLSSQKPHQDFKQLSTNRAGGVCTKSLRIDNHKLLTKKHDFFEFVHFVFMHSVHFVSGFSTFIEMLEMVAAHYFRQA